ncbi:uncharacterized protein [Macaca fascicularis]|uniref:uncharacterized protein n=1 Tax=Macaca fascicularis TaxID=9541 RepID=UPI003D15C264
MELRLGQRWTPGPLPASWGARGAGETTLDPEAPSLRDPRAPARPLPLRMRFSLCKPKQLLASPSRGPFKRGRGFSLARGTLPACRPLRKPRLRFVRGPGTSGGVVRASLAEAAVVSVCWWRNRQVLVEEQADLGGFSTWLQMTRFHPFLWLKNIPFWMYIAVSLSLHQWMNRVTQRRQPKWNVGSTFYNTRDRATMDEEGYIWFLGRSHDTINASGLHRPQDLVLGLIAPTFLAAQRGATKTPVKEH